MSIMKQTKFYILTIVSILMGFSVLAIDFPPWDVPEAEAAKENPLPMEMKYISEGAALYNTQCVACHGANADGMGAIPAANLSTDAFRKQSDGSIFHKLVVGRGTMPSFKALGDESLWKLVLYLRSLGEDLEEVVKKKASVLLSTKVEGDQKMLVAQFFELQENGKESPVANAKAGLYVKRYFGNLPLSKESLFTDEEGKISLPFPNDIPGDNEENLTVLAQLEDFAFENVQASAVLPWGTLLPEDSFTKQWDNTRALWRGNTHVPYWMLGMYLGIAGGVMLGILYVLLLVRKIKLAGKNA